MARESYKDISVVIPERWEDKTVVVFTAPTRKGKLAQPNVVLTRSPLPSGQSLRTFASNELTAMARALKAFELIETRERAIGGAPAIEHRFAWEGQSGSVVQRILFVENGGCVHNVTVTAARTEASELDETFERIFASVVLAPSTSNPRESA